MTWLLMNSGRQHPLRSHHEPALDRSTPDVPTLSEIAHSLAHINRFTGHARRAYSVAEHSLLVADMVQAAGLDAQVQICALMHDAHESITGDVASPIKQVLGTAWAQFEDAQQHALLDAYNLVADMACNADLIKHFDLRALATERRDLLPFDAEVHAPWPIIDTPGAEIRPWHAVDLMAPSRVLVTPRTWAERWTWRTALLMADARIEAQGAAA